MKTKFMKKAAVLISSILLMSPNSTNCIFASSSYPAGGAYSIGGDFHNGDDVRSACDYWAMCGYSSYYNTNPSYSYLNSNIYGNSDGTETAYMFDEPVKYIDEAGNVVDKSNRLYKTTLNLCNDSNPAYVNKFNDIRTYFPETLTTDNGITLIANNESIKMTPNKKIQSKASKSNNTLFYQNRC